MQLRYTSAASRGAKNPVFLLRQLRKPVLTVLKWQLLATVALALLSALLWGRHGAASALAGGLISISAGIAAALVASLAQGRSATSVVMGALRGEAVKLGVAVGLLWLVLMSYSNAVVGVLIGTFIVTLVIFAMAFFVRDY
jgi:ATP synthase protein I